MPSLPVVLPLVVAALLLAARPLASHRRTLDLVAVVTVATVAVILGILVFRTDRPSSYWFGGFRPAHGIALGIDFTIGPLNAGLACLGAILMTAALVFSWRYFTQVGTYFHALMLTFLAGMTGFCLTGDVFDLFVWFELMSVSAYALTAYRPEERGPVQGALNFAITGSIGAYLSLTGIALIYGRTGALNMAQIAAWVNHHPASGLVVVAFLLIVVGLLVKAAIVPFHFWLADAHAVAPTPVCVLFSGVMVELGLYGIARMYWSVFGAALGHREAIGRVFLVLGLVTAVVGALYCFRERHIKRLLAFSTIEHAGVFLAGFALLTPLGLAGAAMYVAAHAFVKGALFLGAGIVLHRLRSVNETALHGRGRKLPLTGALFTAAALGLADLPPFGTFGGKGWIDDSAESVWVTLVLLAAAMASAGSVLRVAGGVFYGLGDPPREDERMAAEANEETGETDTARQRTPLTMLIPATALVAAGLGAGITGMVPRAATALLSAAARFQGQSPGAVLSAEGAPDVTVSSVVIALVSAGGAVIVALAGLYWRRLPLLRRETEPGARGPGLADRFQSGVINDYVTWIVVGLACLGGVLAAIVRLTRPGRGSGDGMSRIGYFLSSEEYDPAGLIRQARLAEQAGFDALWISDHFHPWLDIQGESSFVWSVIGALSQVTSLPIETAVTCPTVRIHPAIIAQAAATSSLLTDGRFALGVGTGEALNEHVTGARWPAADERMDMLEEAVSVIRELLSGKQVSHHGRHYQVETARLYSRPERPPPIHVSGFGPKAARLAARIGDGYICMGPSEDLVRLYRDSGGGDRPVQGGLKACWGPDAGQARATMRRLWSSDYVPGEAGQLLPLPRHFRQLGDLVTDDMVAAPCGPDPRPYVEAVRAFLDAGFDDVYLAQVGGNLEGAFDFFAGEVLPRVREFQPA